MTRAALAFLAAFLCSSAAFAQSGGQTTGGATVPGVTNFCPNGIRNADGSFQVVPCGGAPLGVGAGGGSSSGASVPLYVLQQQGPTPIVSQPLATPQCQVNPITKQIKAYPICF